MKKKKTSILIVDDDKNICRTLSLFLERKGYETDTAYTGKEAIEKSKTKVYNVALLDIKLPDIEGTKLLVTMRETTPKMVKIMITGYPSLGNTIQALKWGSEDYMMKPIDPKELVKVIEEKLQEQEEAEIMTEEKIRGFIETRTQKLLQAAPAHAE